MKNSLIQSNVLFVLIVLATCLSFARLLPGGPFTLFGLLSVESFEGNDFPPAGWSKITNFGGTGWRQGSVGDNVLGLEGFGGIDTPPGGGSLLAYASWATGDADSNFNTDQATDQWLITPLITDIEIGDSLKFYLKYFSQFRDNLDILVSHTNADSTAPFDTTLLTLTFANGSSNEWQAHSLDLSAFADSSIYIAFRERVSTTFNDGDAFLLDLVEVGSLITSVDDRPVAPATFELLQNYPNPFNPTTQIAFSLSHSSEVTLKIYNLLGQEVAVMVDHEVLRAGSHTFQFNASNLQNGIYYYKLAADNFVDVRKMTLLK